MRFMKVAILSALALTVTIAPANAIWAAYISHPFGFAYHAPGDVRMTTGTYESPLAGRRDTIIFQSEEDGIEYKVTMVDMRPTQDNAANLLGEAAFAFQGGDGNTVLMDTYAGLGGVWGRKLTIDLPDNAGRTTISYYFIRGRLIEFRASVPPDGDTGSPNLSRFTDSVTFRTTWARADAIELPMPK